MTPQHFIPSAGVTLAAYTWGNPKTAKATIVLIHGYPDSAKIWQEMAELLANDYYVISYDVRGSGESTIPKRIKQYDLSYLRQDLQAVIDTLAPKQKYIWLPMIGVQFKHGKLLLNLVYKIVLLPIPVHQALV